MFSNIIDALKAHKIGHNIATHTGSHSPLYIGCVRFLCARQQIKLSTNDPLKIIRRM